MLDQDPCACTGCGLPLNPPEIDDLSDGDKLHLAVCPTCLELSVLHVEGEALFARDLTEEEAESFTDADCEAVEAWRRGLVEQNPRRWLVVLVPEEGGGTGCLVSAEGPIPAGEVEQHVRSRVEAGAALVAEWACEPDEGSVRECLSADGNPFDLLNFAACLRLYNEEGPVDEEWLELYVRTAGLVEAEA